MRYYRCYLLAADGHIAMAEILKCVDDSDAARQCRNVFVANRGYAGTEIWDGARHVYRYPRELAVAGFFERAAASSRKRGKGPHLQESSSYFRCSSEKAAARFWAHCLTGGTPRTAGPEKSRQCHSR